MKSTRPLPLLLFLALGLLACRAPTTQPSAPATNPPQRIPTGTTAAQGTPAASPEPASTPTPALQPLEIVEWFEHALPNLVDPSSGFTKVEVLIHNPNDFDVSIDQENAELRFLNSAGEVVYTNPNPFFYIWKGEWMTPSQTAAVQACMCLESQGSERPEWESLELIAPLEIANPAYTLDVEVTAEFVLLEEVMHGFSGPGVAVTLTNTSDQVLESISTLIFARDASGRYVGMASFGNAVVDFQETIGIQPGDTASGLEVSLIDYLGNDRLTYEVAAVGIPLQGATGVPTGAPLLEWKGIPIMPGAVSGGETSEGYEFSTQATVDAITGFYEAALAELGYSLTTSGEQASVTFLLFQKGSAQAIVAILPAGELNRVQLSSTP